MEVTATSLIYRGEPNSRTANCCFPSIARTADSRLWATWRVGSQKDSADGAIWLSDSRDRGRTWSSPREIFAPSMRAGKLREPHYGPLTALRDGRLLCTVMWVDRSDPTKPLFNPETSGLLPMQTLFFESVDEGETWREIGEMDSAPYHTPLAITGPVLELPDAQGWTCPFEVNKPYKCSDPWRHAAAWKFSFDEGRTWPHCVEVANDPAGRLMYWDAHAVVVARSHCLATFWTFDHAENCDRTIHLAESHDYGTTWSAPRDLGIVGQVVEPVPLGGNRLLLIVVDRFETRSICAFLSNDMGHTFDESIVVYRHPESVVEEGKNAATADYLQDMELWTFGRVQAAVFDDDHVAVAYYAGDRASTGIYCASLRATAASWGVSR